MNDEQHEPILEMRMVAAHRAGRECAVNRQRRVNPWRGDADTAEERVLSIMWARGFSEGNPVRLDD